MNVKLTLYAVTNEDGQYMPKSSSWKNWTDSITEARIYTKPGPARSLVTSYTKQGIRLNLVELRVTESVTIDETARVKESLVKKAKQEALRNKRILEMQCDEAKRKLKEAQETLMQLELQKSL